LIVKDGPFVLNIDANSETDFSIQFAIYNLTTELFYQFRVRQLMLQKLFIKINIDPSTY